MVRTDSHGITRAPWYSGLRTIAYINVLRTRLSLSMAVLSRTFDYVNLITIQDLYILIVHTPQPHYYNAHRLSRNKGLDLSPFAHHYWGNHFVFFSWRYLDVSVHVVRFLILCIQIRMTWFCQAGLPHSEIFGSKLDWQLPEAYGSLPPPSSPLDTKASTKSPFQLITNLLICYKAI